MSYETFLKESQKVPESTNSAHVAAREVLALRAEVERLKASRDGLAAEVETMRANESWWEAWQSRAQAAHPGCAALDDQQGECRCGAEVERLRDELQRVDDERIHQFGLAEQRKAEVERLTKERDGWQEHHHVAVREVERLTKEVKEWQATVEQLVDDRSSAYAERNWANERYEEASNLAGQNAEWAEEAVARALKAEADAARLRETLREVLAFDARTDRPDVFDRARAALAGRGTEGT